MLGRILAWIRPGFVTDPTLQPRLSGQGVLAMVGASVGPSPSTLDMAWAGVALVEGRLVWTACISDQGVTTCSTIDDATGTLGITPLATLDVGGYRRGSPPMDLSFSSGSRRVFWVALACNAGVDAAAGVLAASIAKTAWPGTGWLAMVFVTTVLLGSMCHVMAPGWLLIREPGGSHPITMRLTAGFHALVAALTVLVVLLLAMIAAGSIVPSFGLILLVATPAIVAAILGLGAAWAQAVDPRTRLAAPPIVQAECLAVAGLLMAWAPPGALLATGMLGWQAEPGQVSLWSGLLLGAYGAMAVPLMLNMLVIGNLVAAEDMLAPVGTMARRAIVCSAVLLIAAATLLVASPYTHSL